MRYAERIAAGAALLTFAAAAPFSWAQTTNEGEGYAQRLRELLNNQGYSQIEFLDLNGDTYSANACSDDRTYRLTFNRNARIIEKSETGDCAPPTPDQQVSEDVIIDALYGRGYLRINIVDRTPPTLLVNACRGGRKFQVRMDNEGDIVDVKADGECDLAAGDPLAPRQIEHILSLQGYRKIRMAAADDAPFTVTACNGVREFELQVSAAAQVTMRKAVGFCNAEDEEVKYVPPRPVEEARLTTTDPLEPESCQMVLDWLQYETPLTFRRESTALSDADLTLIETMAETVQRCPSTQILVEGHTSRAGDDAFNQDLSEKRALAVHQAIVEAGINDQRLTAHGFGEAHPHIIGGADENLNRRIEIQLEWNAAMN